MCYPASREKQNTTTFSQIASSLGVERKRGRLSLVGFSEKLSDRGNLGGGAEDPPVPPGYREMKNEEREIRKDV